MLRNFKWKTSIPVKIHFRSILNPQDLVWISRAILEMLSLRNAEVADLSWPW